VVCPQPIMQMATGKGAAFMAVTISICQAKRCRSMCYVSKENLPFYSSSLRRLWLPACVCVLICAVSC
jgi:hypothetical protein